MTISFVPARQEDIPSIFQLNKELIDTYEDIASIDYDRVIRWVQRNIEQQLSHFRRVLADGSLAGYFCLIPTEEKWELDSLFVLPPYQNQGIGTQILEFARKEAHGNLFFFVFKENTNAIRLYERMGFRIVKEIHKTRFIME